MTALFYRFLMLLAQWLGLAPFMLFSSLVAAGYFLIFPKRVAVSVRFYRALFPDKPRWYAVWSAWKQYHSFTNVFLDRFLLCQFGDISYTSEGWEHIENAITNRTGGIILMSHIGNWEVAAHLMKQKAATVPVLFYMGTKHKEEIEHMQKKSISQRGIRIIAVDKDGGSPTDILESIRFLKAGGLVSMTGDHLWQKHQRRVAVRLLDREVFVPEIPYVLAMLSGSPLFIFFSFRAGRRRHSFISSHAIHVRAFSHSQRKTVIREAAQTYASLLEQQLRQHPWEWYHFEPFFASRANPDD